MKPYGYGIVDKDDQPWWEDDLYCCEKECEMLNNNTSDLIKGNATRRPYRVVRLVFEELE